MYSFESYCLRKVSFEYVSNSFRRFLSFIFKFYSNTIISEASPEVRPKVRPEVILSRKRNIPHTGVQYYIFYLVKLYQFYYCRSFVRLHKVLLKQTFQDFSIFRCEKYILHIILTAETSNTANEARM